MAARIKKGDLVEVIAGKEGPRASGERGAGGRRRGKRGRVLKVLPKEQRVIVEGVNVVRCHRSPRKYPQGGIVEKEAPIHISNVMLVDPKLDVPTRVRFGVDKDGRKVRIAVKSGTIIDRV